MRKSRYGSEFHPFLLEAKFRHVEEFCGLLHVHKIRNVDILLGFADLQGNLLPINNTDKYSQPTAYDFNTKERKKQIVPLVQTL